MNFIIKLHRGNFYFSCQSFQIFVDNWRYGSHDKIHNVSSLSLNLCLLGQKTQGHGM